MEEWRDIKELEGLYQVSNLGRIKSLRKEEILKPSTNGWGYLSLSLSKDGKDYTKRVHILVAIAFLNHKPDNTQKIVVDHINGNKLNNEVTNLQLISQRRNSIKSIRNTTSKLPGVSWSNKENKWISQIYYNNKNIRLGCFKDEKEANKLYTIALQEIENNRFDKRNVKSIFLSK